MKHKADKHLCGWEGEETYPQTWYWSGRLKPTH